MPSTEVDLSVEDLVIGYSKRPLLSEITLAMSRGSRVGISGPNGCGKSTLMRTIAGLVDPIKGRVVVRGCDVTSVSTPKRARVHGVRYLRQGSGVFMTLSIQDNLRLAAWSRPNSEDVMEILREPPFRELTSRLHTPVATLSGGEKALVGLVCALVAKPRILLLDEPVSGLSARFRESIGQLLLKDAEHRTVLIVEHSREFLAGVCDRIVACQPSSVVGAPLRLTNVEK